VNSKPHEPPGHYPVTLQAAPLLLAQEGLWFVDQLGSGSAAYSIHSVTRLKGRLDVERLRRGLHALLARHANLRTGFHATDTEPEQRVIPAAQATERFSLQHMEIPEGADATARIAAIIAEPFDLSRAPLLRAVLLRISGDHHVLVLVAHHIGGRMVDDLLHRDWGVLCHR
jgi:hypothetical protein